MSFLFRAFHLSGVSCGYPGVPLLHRGVGTCELGLYQSVRLDLGYLVSYFRIRQLQKIVSGGLSLLKGKGAPGDKNEYNLLFWDMRF